jgi:hypothetical protein
MPLAGRGGELSECLPFPLERVHLLPHRRTEPPLEGRIGHPPAGAIGHLENALVLPRHLHPSPEKVPRYGRDVPGPERHAAGAVAVERALVEPPCEHVHRDAGEHVPVELPRPHHVQPLPAPRERAHHLGEGGRCLARRLRRHVKDRIDVVVVPDEIPLARRAEQRPVRDQEFVPRPRAQPLFARGERVEQAPLAGAERRERLKDIAGLRAYEPPLGEPRAQTVE